MKKLISGFVIAALLFSQINVLAFAEEEDNIDINQDYAVNEDVELNINNDNIIYEGEAVTVEVKLKNTENNYEYSFVQKDTEAELLQDFSESDSYRFSAEGVGIHTIRVLLKDAEGNLSMRDKTYEVTETADASSENESSIDEKQNEQEDQGQNTVTNRGINSNVTDGRNVQSTNIQPEGRSVLSVDISSSSSTVNVGNSVTLTARGSGGSGDYEYRFTETYNGVVTTVQSYSSTPTYTFTAAGNGLHRFTVAVRDKSGNVTSGISDVTVKEEALKLTLSSDKSNAGSGDKVTLTAKGSGGSGNYEYRFTETYNGVVTTVQSYSSTPTYTFTAAGNGLHRFTVAVRDKSGNVTSGISDVTVKEEALKLTLSSDKSNAGSGDKVTLTAKGSGGSGNYEYRFTETYNGVVTTVQSYSSTPTYTFTAAGNGLHRFTVAVRDKSGNVASGICDVNVKEVPISLTVSSDKSTIETEGTDIVLTAKGNGGSGGYEYRFTETFGDDITTVQSYSSKASYSFKAAKAGVHKYTVAVKDSAGNTTSVIYSLKVEPKPLPIIVTNSTSASEVLGTEITLTAKASDGNEPYEYRFTDTYAGVSTTVQSYSAKSTYTVVPQGIGEHKYTVAVKDADGRIGSVIYTMIVKPETGYELSVSVKSSQPQRVKTGTEVTITASAAGGYGDTLYRFTETYQGSSVTRQSYSRQNTYAFKATGIGEHIYTIAVQDKEGQTTSASYSMMVYDDTLRGIDVSSYQGDINWQSVKNSGINFAMLRVLSGTMSNLTVDSKFNANIAGASNNGIAVGVYRYGYAMTVAEAQREAKETINAIKSSGYSITYPIAYDVEDTNTQGKLSKSQLTAIIKAYKGVIENNGYKFMIYANADWLKNKIDMNSFADADVWIASWFLDGTPNHDYGYSGPGTVTIWQYYNQGKVPGISGDVDMNIGYKSY
ncbi:GH25 family lysozyme [[Clostridium] hylemonae]|uniref:GH25 family lysozyme n=1 Tax=[Clostridium] hylemonae TaxID=89153 RepID=UPI001106C9C1|nr:GH25 family lysozyme [[Clostridium] hylemonae]